MNLDKLFIQEYCTKQIFISSFTFRYNSVTKTVTATAFQAPGVVSRSDFVLTPLARKALRNHQETHHPVTITQETPYWTEEQPETPLPTETLLPITPVTSAKTDPSVLDPIEVLVDSKERQQEEQLVQAEANRVIKLLQGTLSSAPQLVVEEDSNSRSTIFFVDDEYEIRHKPISTVNKNHRVLTIPLTYFSSSH